MVCLSYIQWDVIYGVENPFCGRIQVSFCASLLQARERPSEEHKSKGEDPREEGRQDIVQPRYTVQRNNHVHVLCLSLTWTLLQTRADVDCDGVSSLDGLDICEELYQVS